MDKTLMSEWWCKRGESVAAMAAAERSLLELLRLTPATTNIGCPVRHALGCLLAAQRFVQSDATIAIEHEAARKEQG
jgi:hypothetical protein